MTPRAIRGLLTQIHPAQERVLGPEVHHKAVLELLSRCGGPAAAPVLTSMPGIGVRTAARILLEVGDGTAFATLGHLAAYAGLAPVTRRSGSSIHGEHPPRGGNKHLKRAFFLAAFASLADPVNRAYYDRKRAEGKPQSAVLICLARRRCDVLFAMLRDKSPTNHGQRHQ